MFGIPKARKPNHEAENLQVNDIFYTIQGEGPFAGRPAVFVRLTGCNLRCWFCDTAWDDEHDLHMAPGQIVTGVKAQAECPHEGVTRTRLVVITGGEPLRQDLSSLIHLLGVYGYEVQVETAGVIWQDVLFEDHVTIVVSPKTKNVHRKFLQHAQHWKYVVGIDDANSKDGLPVEETQRDDDKETRKGGVVCRPPQTVDPGAVTVYLSPMDTCNDALNKMNAMVCAELALKFAYRAGLQMHKIFGVK